MGVIIGPLRVQTPNSPSGDKVSLTHTETLRGIIIILWEVTAPLAIARGEIARMQQWALVGPQGSSARLELNIENALYEKPLSKGKTQHHTKLISIAQPRRKMRHPLRTGSGSGGSEHHDIESRRLDISNTARGTAKQHRNVQLDIHISLHHLRISILTNDSLTSIHSTSGERPRVQKTEPIPLVHVYERVHIRRKPPCGGHGLEDGVVDRYHTIRMTIQNHAYLDPIRESRDIVRLDFVPEAEALEEDLPPDALESSDSLIDSIDVEDGVVGSDDIVSRKR